MPLPPALAARLAKRGILKPASANNEQVEEIIAEDYDDHHEPGHPVGTNPNIDGVPSADVSRDNMLGADEEDESDELFFHTNNCPNCVNPYHTCSEYCRKRWGFKRFKPDTTALRGREHLLKRYPLPPGWLEVGDPNTGRYYYWNTETEEVSWLSPEHPHAIVTLSAEKLKELARGVSSPVRDDRDSHGESDDDSTDLDDENYVEDDKHNVEERERDRRRRDQSERDRGKDHQRSRGRVDDSLDPMDPAAYSDVPRGSWTSGLETRETAKTGADVTASGPLFQQRPYPSPGAVLRMNKDKKKK